MTTSDELVRLTATLTGEATLSAQLNEEATLSARLNVPSSVVSSNYDELTNKPKVNGVELIGDRSFEDLGETTMTNLEIKEAFDREFGGRG